MNIHSLVLKGDILWNPRLNVKVFGVTQVKISWWKLIRKCVILSMSIVLTSLNQTRRWCLINVALLLDTHMIQILLLVDLKDFIFWNLNWSVEMRLRHVSSDRPMPAWDSFSRNRLLLWISKWTCPLWAIAVALLSLQALIRVIWSVSVSFIWIYFLQCSTHGRTHEYFAGRLQISLRKFGPKVIFR